ncbi:MAG: hypothetical protein HGJ94_13925 [Desulfosarcina sp.]|nr:hypothetical protein [Desulfosarcina sp.]MBC2744965.1 hypothetical protein [Desulfosarcina sp.]MBC2767873.1 hypothetical protein [Desulfosarcina sp.]
MNPKLFLLFNHQITVDQEADARKSLGVASMIEPPERIKDAWKRVPPNPPSIESCLEPVKSWLSEEAGPGDYLLVQGDFGATWLMVRFAFELGLIPVYSTTERLVKEERSSDGVVNATHTFRHRIFRQYGR